METTRKQLLDRFTELTVRQQQLQDQRKHDGSEYLYREAAMIGREKQEIVRTLYSLPK